MATTSKIAVIIPCYNEAKGIGSVIDKIPWKRAKRQHWEIEVIVVDNNSTDNTAEVAKKHGATVIHEPKKGKGNAIRTGFANIPADTDYIVMLDGDDTYDAGEVLRMVEPLYNDFCKVVIGSRLSGKIDADAMSFTSRLGNWFFTHIVRIAHNVAVTDVLTGYFAWKKEVLDDLAPHLKSHGFAIEMEMITRMARMGYDIYSVPISYTPRAGESNLRPFYDGSRILHMFAQTLRWKPHYHSKKNKTSENNKTISEVGEI